jgi:hypothetical protein
MTLQLLHSEFPFISGKFYFISYQCVNIPICLFVMFVMSFVTLLFIHEGTKVTGSNCTKNSRICIEPENGKETVYKVQFSFMTPTSKCYTRNGTANTYKGISKEKNIQGQKGMLFRDLFH